jgi:hypothetical protein
MSLHILANPETFIDQAFPDSNGNTHCVQFIKQTLKAPATRVWKEGKKIVKGDETIPFGTAIATFVDGEYPQTGSTNKHAAIYLSQTALGLVVLDQWKPKDGKVKAVAKRTIKFVPTMNGLGNDGNAFSVIDW